MPDHHKMHEDEITLPGFRNIIKQFFRFIFWVWAFFVVVLKQHKFLLLLGLSFGLLLGYLYYISRPTYYKVTMILQNNELSKRTYAEMVQQLNSELGGGAGRNIAAKLGTSEEIASKILYVEAKTIGGDPLLSDTSTKLRQPFKLIAGLSDKQYLDSIQSLLLRLLNNGPYLKTLREEQTRLYNERLGFFSSELQKLDSLKSEYNKFLASSKISATFYNNAFNPADIYSQSNSLYMQREATLRWLFIDKDAVAVIDGFKSPRSPNSISLTKSLFILGGAGLFIAFLLGLLRQAKKRLD